MIKVSVFYPYQPNTRFDMTYYCDRHIPLVRRLLGAAVKNAAVELGLSGGTRGSSPLYIAMGHMYFDSVSAFIEAWGPHAAEVLADIPNYTDLRPQFQISEVKL
ncbi:MAG: EthD family reductase [Acidobacteria bacterium]|nr:EthD family reductase [Acidobacteriota bacterium]